MDIARIEELIRLMDEHGLVELEIDEEGRSVKLKKANGIEVMQVAPAVAAQPVQMIPAASPTAPAAPAAAAPAAEAAGSPESEGVEVIKSPMVGTFYRAPSPDQKSFVEVGDPVDEDTPVCIVEAMKVMNEVHAEVVGTISKVLAEDGTPVEFGQPLFEVVA